MIKKILTSIVAAALILSSGLVPANSAYKASGADLSDYGKNSISELATCLRTSETLDVFYLVDASTSLETSDPKNQRSGIIAQDIVRWADITQIQPNLKVQVAGALFNESTSKIADWQRLDSANAPRVASKFTSFINNRNLGNYTNWRAGLQEAYDQMQRSDAECKAVIWFTDGGLWSATGSQPRIESLTDLEALCGPSKSGDVTRNPSS